jgi:hypothetical protein
VHVINHSPCNPASTPEREHSITVNIRDTICIERGSTTCDFGVVTGKWNPKMNIIYREKKTATPFSFENYEVTKSMKIVCT